MHKMVTGLTFVLAGLAAMPAQAQDAPAGGHSSGIVVEGRKQGPRKETRTFVRQVMTTTKEQLSRFEDPVCPVVLGLPPAYAKAVAKRFMEVSTEAGARVDRDEKCNPNIFVIVAADASKFIAELRQKYHGFFDDLAYDDKRTALDEGPVRAWRVAEELDQDGRRALESNGPRSFNGVAQPSRISLSTQQATFGAVVVLDANAVDNKSVGQIADYVAMRTLAGARPPKASTRLDTILSLFDAEGDAPEGLTEVDRSFLKGVYEMQANGRSGSQIGTIADQILRDRDKAAAEKKPN
ncbi:MULTISPECIES: hypothetical protein [Sphingomonas]|uniref:DUF2927 domain-containing protein n=1 Tax=Sphingomonas kyeonggiensis TaxID=1268553 RepID=A0A7W7K1H0_9SPHN|nr:MULTISPECIES: hypothetical protein [Sphingomonas]MBB4838978.1 hypothetical protein [Sphingomonas kyeonggiensis]WHU03805.1 hypothetical protein O3305_04215 [Sphingomonas sp. NIBR02145]